MRYIFLLILMLGFVSSLDVDLNCPSEVMVDEEFTCTFEILDSSEVYDIKMDISEDGSSVARIFDEEKDDFESAYYYLNEFSGNEVLLKITEAGTYDSFLKLRKDSFSESIAFEISVIGGDGSTEEDDLEVVEEEKLEEVESAEEDIVREALEALIPKTPRETISLNSVDAVEIDVAEKVLVYESREARNFNYLPYVFSLFLGIVIVFLLWEKF